MCLIIHKFHAMIHLNIYSLGEFKNNIIINDNITVDTLKKLVSDIIKHCIYEFTLVDIKSSRLFIPHNKNIYEFIEDNKVYDIYYIRHDILSSYVLHSICKINIFNNISNESIEIIKNNKFLLYELLHKNIKFLDYFDDNIKNDREIILYAIKINGLVMQYVSNELKDDKDIVSKAILKEPLAIEYISDRLKNDLDIILLAINKNGFMYQYISDKLRDNEYILFKALEYKSIFIGTIYQYASERLRDNEEILRKVLNTTVNWKYKSVLISYASPRLKRIYL